VCVCCDSCVIVASPFDHHFVVVVVVANFFTATTFLFEFLTNHSSCKPIYYPTIFKLEMEAGAFLAIRYLNIKL
jgi:hypothetical protein